MKSAVLFIVFNRPDTTQKVFDAIRSAKPKKLYIAADGPRVGNIRDLSRCKEVRDIVYHIDWPCEVFKLFRDNNLGTKYGIAEAINWFFSNEEEGIILEDDVLPMPSFFQFCDEMLDYYRNSPMVSIISGNNNISPYCVSNESYFFSKYAFLWGWATWRRAWQYFDITMDKWPNWKDSDAFKILSDDNRYYYHHWKSLLDDVYKEKINTCWDYQWLFNHWQNGFLSVIPKNNLIKNIGFGDDATHTFGVTPDYMKKAIPENIIFPLVHPKDVSRNIGYDQIIDKVVIHLTFKESLMNKLRNSFLGPYLRKIKHKIFKF